MPQTAKKDAPGGTVPTISRDELKRRFLTAWNRFEWLMGGVRQDDEALGCQPHPFRNELKFYYGHTAAFYIQKLRLAGVLEDGVESFDDELERGVSPDSPEEIEALQDWPEAETLRAYRADVRETVLGAIEGLAAAEPLQRGTAAWALAMGIEHENIHLHTSIPLIRQLDPECKRVPDGWPRRPRSTSGHGAGWLPVPGGTLRFGIEPGRERGFHWDNELGVRVERVEDFEVARGPVTNREFLEFVRDGGYGDRALWTTHEAGVYLDTMQPEMPLAWIRPGGGEYRYRDVFAVRDMDWDAPVEVNRHEASAYANWAGCELVSEARYHALLRRFFAVPADLEPRGGEFDIGFGGPGRAADGDRPDAVGNVALWAADDFQPLDPEGFVPDPFYEDFSAPWFGPQTGLLLGASYAACGHLAEVGVMRDFMQNHMDQPAGILLTRSR